MVNQETFLRKAVSLCVRHGKALVVHCRDAGTGEASNKTLTVLQDLQATELPVHRHCFSAGPLEMERWLSTCPIVIFGFTSTLLSNPQTMEAAKKLDVNRILLETDSPYLPMEKHAVNTPWHILPIVEKVAHLKNLPFSILVQITNRNARKLYSF